MVAILAPQLPLAYLAACFAVARARRGDVPDWRGVFARLGRIADVLPPRAASVFLRPPAPRRGSNGGSTAGRCRRWTAILLPFELAAALRRPPRAGGPHRRDAPRHAADPALPGRLRRRDRRPLEPRCEPFLWPDAVRGDAAAHHRGARRREAADGDCEHARRMAAGPRRRPARAHAVRQLADRGRKGPSRGPSSSARPARSSSRCFVSWDSWPSRGSSSCKSLSIGLTGREGLIKASVLLRLSSLIFDRAARR